MELLPGLRDAFAAMTEMGSPPEGLSAADSRAWYHERIDANFTALSEDRPPAALEVDYQVPVDGITITVRVYRPDLAGPLPCYIYFHGGGFWLGTISQANSTCRGISTDVGCAVVNVDYRLAPESKFPAAPEDCYAALLWVVEHADELGIDARRIAVGGGSAGGNLAAVVALMARDRGGPLLALQVLEVAVLDFTTPGKEAYLDLYLGSAENATDPYASPMLASSLAGLPPAVVMRAEFDRLTDEDAAYAQRLREAGIEVEERLWSGQFHGSMHLAKLIPDEAGEYHRQIVAALRRAFAP